MEPTEHGRYCRRCEREVIDLTRSTSLDAALQRLGQEAGRTGIACVRMWREACPSEARRRMAWAAMASTLLVACAHPRYPSSPPLADGSRREYSACRSLPGDPWAARELPADDTPQVCRVAPDSRQCQVIAAIAATHDRAMASLPAHLRADCDDVRWARGEVWAGGVGAEINEYGEEFPPPYSWPDGLDVVVTGIAADGTDWTLARRAALGMIEPLARCYAAVLDRTPGDRPQGTLRLQASVGPDGRVREVGAENEGLPRDLVDCALGAFRASTFGAGLTETATVSIDVRFLYRLPFVPHQGR